MTTVRRSPPTAAGPSPRGRLAGAGLALMLLLLGACGSVPSDQFYTLRGEAGGAAPPAAAGVPAGASVAVGPVTVPALLDRPQWVLQDGPNQVRVMQQQRWAQPLQADIAQAVAGHLNRELGDIAYPEASGSPAGWPVMPRLRVQIDVLRFESRLLDGAAIDDQYRWAVSCAAGNRPLPSRGGIAAAAGPVEAAGAEPFRALARAHADGLRRASADIAAALRQLGSACAAP